MHFYLYLQINICSSYLHKSDFKGYHLFFLISLFLSTVRVLRILKFIYFLFSNNAITTNLTIHYTYFKLYIIEYYYQFILFNSEMETNDNCTVCISKSRNIKT